MVKIKARIKGKYRDVRLLKRTKSIGLGFNNVKVTKGNLKGKTFNVPIINFKFIKSKRKR